MAKQKLLDDLDKFANQGFDQLEGGIRDTASGTRNAVTGAYEGMKDSEEDAYRAENFWRSAWQDSDDLENWRSKNKPGTED